MVQSGIFIFLSLLCIIGVIFVNYLEYSIIIVSRERSYYGGWIAFLVMGLVYGHCGQHGRELRTFVTFADIPVTFKVIYRIFAWQRNTTLLKPQFCHVFTWNIHILHILVHSCTTVAVIDRSSSTVHRGRDKMAAIFLYEDTFSCMKIIVFRSKFRWNLFPRIQVTISQHWFRKWLGA